MPRYWKYRRHCEQQYQEKHERSAQRCIYLLVPMHCICYLYAIIYISLHNILAVSVQCVAGIALHSATGWKHRQKTHIGIVRYFLPVLSLQMQYICLQRHLFPLPSAPIMCKSTVIHFSGCTPWVRRLYKFVCFTVPFLCICSRWCHSHLPQLSFEPFHLRMQISTLRS